MEKIWPRLGIGARCCIALVVSMGGSSAVGMAQPEPGVIPIGTHIHFHLTQPVSSDKSKTGGSFAFVLLEPIVVADQTIPVEGTAGIGTIVLAGHAGNQGHEGDLTLRIDSLQTTDGRYVAFANQRFEINGHNRKVASAGLGFVPVVGYASFLIRGSEVHVDPTQAIETVLARPAKISLGPPPPTPSASPTGAQQPQPSPTPVPTAPGAVPTPSPVPSAAPAQRSPQTPAATLAPAPMPLRTLSPPPPP